MIPVPDPNQLTVSAAVETAVYVVNAIGSTLLLVIGFGVGAVIIGLIIRALREALRDAI